MRISERRETMFLPFSSEQVLHAAALLVEIADEDALLLEQGLVAVEFAGALVVAVFSQLHSGVGLAALGAQGPVLALQLAQVVHRQRRAQGGELLGQVAVTPGLVHLFLEGAQLARDLALHILGSGEVHVHGGQLALGALLAAAVLADARGLLDQFAALLGSALQDGVELALADDGVGVLAQAGVVQDVLDVAQAGGRPVDQVL